MSDVLVVDDEAGIRHLLLRWLTGAGHVVHEAADAESALRILAETAIGAVLCDRAMPGHDGLWLVERMRESHPSVAIILATADDGLPPQVTLQQGVLGYLVKPFKQELVLAAVHDALAWHRVAKQSPPRRPAGDDAVDTWLKGRAGRPEIKDEP